MSEPINFWGAFWLLIVLVPLMLVWGFTIVDIFRRDDMSGLAKAGWLVVVLVLPLVGTLAYLLLRPTRTAAAQARPDAEPQDPGPQYSATNRAEQLHLLAELHDRGKLSDPEFSAEKARLAAAPVLGSEAFVAATLGAPAAIGTSASDGFGSGRPVGGDVGAPVRSGAPADTGSDRAAASSANAGRPTAGGRPAKNGSRNARADGAGRARNARSGNAAGSAKNARSAGSTGPARNSMADDGASRAMEPEPASSPDPATPPTATPATGTGDGPDPKRTDPIITRMAAPDLTAQGIPMGTPANGNAPIPPMADTAKR